MEPSDSLELQWDCETPASPSGNPRGRGRFAVMSVLFRIMVVTVAFAAGFATKSILALHPQSVPVTDGSGNSAPMIANSAILSTENTVTVPTNPSANQIEVDVHGDVLHPGLYTLPVTARFSDAVQAAGGFLHSADAGQVNLAQALTDGQEVIVPAVNPNPPVAANGANSSSGIAGAGVGTNATGTPAASTASTTVGSSAQGTSPGPGQLIDLNTADVATLETLPDIGPSRAQAIADYRQAHGPFKDVAGVKDVRGIGAGIFAKIQPFLTVAGSSP